MKLLCLTTFPVEAAATRYRCVQFFSYLAEHGFECRLRPFLSPELFGKFYRKGRVVAKSVQLGLATLSRLTDIVRPECDLVLVQREAALFGPPVIEWFLTRILKKPLVFDFDDAIYVPYISPTYGRLASALKFPRKTESNIVLSRHVIAGNQLLADYALRFNRNVTIIPTVVDVGRYRVEKKRVSAGLPILGWIGSPTTTQYLKPIIPVIRDLSQRHHFAFRVVGANEHIQIDGVAVQNEPWRMEREIGDFQSLDIGLYPVTEDQWSVGKSGFKAIQYMAAGVACIASPVGVIKEIIQDGVNGFVATTHREWLEKLSLLIKDHELRIRLGAEGQHTVEQRYSLDVHAPRLLAVLQAAART